MLIFGVILDFRTLFPYVSVSGASLTIITLYEKQNPVALGSDLVDADLNRINLIEQVIMSSFSSISLCCLCFLCLRFLKQC